MSQCIWKFKLTIAHEQTVRMPLGAKILSAQVQPSVDPRQICIWAVVDPKARFSQRHIIILGTGHDIVVKGRLDFINTVQLDEGKLVLHVFEWTPGEFSVLS